jgi:hypothetical protein
MMKKASLIASAVAVSAVAFTGNAFAQDGPFKDVPNDHWAYGYIDKLAKERILVGDPDGAYRGKRNLTRYEMAAIIARLLDLLDDRYAKAGSVGGGSAPVDTSGFATKADVDALRGQLANKLDKSDFDALRRLVAEFQTELTTLGVDLDAVKKRLDSLEGRVSAIEADLAKRVRVNGAANFYARGAHVDNKRPGTLFDKDGYVVGNPASNVNGAAASSGVLGDTRIFHDIDLDLTAKPNDNTTVELTVNFGTYLDYLGSVIGFTGRPRSSAGIVNQAQSQTVYKALVNFSTGLPIVGKTGITLGRQPIAFSKYTLQSYDPDWYFTNNKTDKGTIPVDGIKLGSSLGRFDLQLVAAKVDPIAFSSDVTNANGGGAFGLYAGAATGSYGQAFDRGDVLGSGVSTFKNGAILVEQLAGLNLGLPIGPFKVTGTALVLAGPSNSTLPVLAANNFSRVNVYGASLTGNLGSIAIDGNYAKADTAGTTPTKYSPTQRKVTSQNDAYDISAGLRFGSINVLGGYRHVGPYFGAPGNWARIGTYQNPTDIQGPFATAGWKLNNNTSLSFDYQNYEGTGKAIGNGGLTKNDEFQNFRGTLKLGGFRVGGEQTTFKLNGSNAKPKETFLNVGYDYDFNASSTLRLIYQAIEFDNKNSAFSNGNSKGGIVSGQFSVKF